MEKDAEPKAEDGKPSSLIGNYLMWFAVALLVYCLSSGPAIWLEANHTMSNDNYRRLDTIYTPIGWAYQNTFLHKPIGMYLHLWAPKLIDKHGNSAIPTKP